MAEILVLGAGMAGVSAALELQARGHNVVVADRKAPGQETSFGNAGIIQAEAAEPYALPRDLPTLLSYALGQSNDVTWSWRAVLSMAPALWRYFRTSAPDHHQALSRIYAQLTRSAPRDHAPLITASGADNLISREGFNFLFRHQKNLDAAAADLDRLEQLYGITSRVLDGQAFRSEEPALKAAPAGAIHWLQSWTCSDPGSLVGHYADLFVQRGGRMVSANATGLRATRSGWSLPGAGGPLEAEHAVVALGPWSPEVLKPLGYTVRMVLKRGYHGHYAAPLSLRRPFVDTDYGVVAASMRQGLRVSTGAALVPMSAPHDTRQLERAVHGLSPLLDLGPRIEEPQWSGTRPCLPDMLPLAGPAPRHKGLWFHFGHGHQGFTLGPTTARLLADAFEGKTDSLVSALSPLGRV